jgi:cholesterol transport system auxiliary component
MSDHRYATSGLRHAVRLTALMLVAACAGCVSGAFDSELPPQHVYVLSPLPAAAGDVTPLPVGLTVARPTARPGLDTDHIALRQPDRRLDYYAAARWGAETQVVVQDLLIQSLRNTGRLTTVQGDLSPFVVDYVLQTDLADFQAEYAGGGANPLVRVTLVCTVGRVKDRKPLADFVAAATTPAGTNSLGAVVQAFETAYQQAARIAVDETLKALTAAGPPAAAAAAAADH